MNRHAHFRPWHAAPGLAVALVLAALGVGAVAAANASAATSYVPAAHVPTGFNNNAVADGYLTARQSTELQRAAGADVDRVTVNWPTLERSPGNFDWGVYDAIYEADRARRIKPLFVLAYAPKWARAAGGPCGEVVWGCHEPPAPQFYDEYARVAAKLAQRYPEAAGIEIWNEPNTPYFWRPAPDPIAYTALLANSYVAIKTVRPKMRVVAGATAAGYGSVLTGKVSGWDFLGTMYGAGAKDFMDVISVHAYPSATDPSMLSALPNVDYARTVRDWFADSSTPIWVTETGISSTGADAVSESEQAARLRQLEGALRSVEAVEMVLIHTLIEPNRAAGDTEVGYGVVTRSLRKKPAYCQLALGWGRIAC